MIRRSCAIVIALVMMLALPATAQESPLQLPAPSSSQSVQSPPVAQPEKAEPAQYNQDATRNPVVEHGANKPPQDQGGTGDSGRGDDGKRVGHFGSYTPDEVTAAFTIALAFATLALVGATILLAVATVGLWRETKKLAAQAVEASKDTKASLQFAEVSAKAAKQSAETAERLMLGAEAPFLSPRLTFNYSRNARRVGEADPTLGTIGYNWFNNGRSNAVLLEDYCDVQQVTYFNEIGKEKVFGYDHSSQIIRPDTESGRVIVEIASDKAAIAGGSSDESRFCVLILTARYADMFGNQFICRYCYDIDTARFQSKYIISGLTVFRRVISPDEIEKFPVHP